MGLPANPSPDEGDRPDVAPLPASPAAAPDSDIPEPESESTPEMTDGEPDAEPAPAPAAPADQSSTAFGWIFLVATAILLGLINPLVVEFEVRLDLTIGLLVVGIALVGVGWWRGRWPLLLAGAVVLWSVIILGTCTQIIPLTAQPGSVWAPRGLLLMLAALGWLLFLGAPTWMLRGALAMAVPTVVMLAVMWFTVPLFPQIGSMFWLAVDSQGTLYATDTDNGFVWVLDSNGGVRGKLWPRRAAPGTPGPGFVPPGVAAEITVLVPQATPTPGGPLEREFLFCGLAVDPTDNLYIVDPHLFRVRQYNRDGQVLQEWPLPQDYIPARGCLAADQDHVYVGDNHGIIYVYDHAGKLLTQWTTDDVSLGLAVGRPDELTVLHQTRVQVLQFPSGKEIHAWQLPTSPNDVIFEALAVLPDGSSYISDLSKVEIAHFGPNGERLAPLGGLGTWPGQFAELGGLTVDRQGRLYVSDFQYRVVQRFGPDGHVQTVWTAPEPGGEQE